MKFVFQKRFLPYHSSGADFFYSKIVLVNYNIVTMTSGCIEFTIMCFPPMLYDFKLQEIF